MHRFGLGFTATAAFGLLTTLLDRIGTVYPDIVVDLVELVTRQQLAGLLAGELDLGLARPPFDGTIFSSRLIHREALLAAVPAGHRLAQLPRPLSAADLVDQPLIIHSPNTARYFSDLITRFIPLADQHVASTVGQILTMLWLVAGGRGHRVRTRLGAAARHRRGDLSADRRPAGGAGRTSSRLAH